MKSNKNLPRTISEQLDRDKKTGLSERGIQLVFSQNHSSRTSYHNSTDWLKCRINLVTRVPVDFKQKTNLAIKDWLDPQSFLRFSDLTWYDKWCIFCVFSCFMF